MAVAFRRHTLLPMNDCLYALQSSIPHLTRSSLHRRLQRHGISRLAVDESGELREATLKLIATEIDKNNKASFSRFMANRSSARDRFD